MRILQVVPYFYPAWSYGGPAKLVKDTTDYFASMGHQVTVYTSDSYDRDRRMPIAMRAKNSANSAVFYFRNISNTFAYRHHIFIAPMMFFQIIWELSSFDIVHIHDFYIVFNVWVALLCRVFHKPYVISVHGCLEEKRMEDKNGLKRLFLHVFGISILQHAKALIATSQNERKAYLSYDIPKEKIFMMGHGVNTQEFFTKKTKSVCRRIYHLKKTSFVISFVGRIHKIKGLDILVHAIARMKTDAIQVVIAGSDDGFLKDLKNLISLHTLNNSIQVYGPCFGQKKAELFRASDLFVYPSYSEGFSLGILEAAGSGLPLLITKGCHFEKVIEWNAGLVVESNPEAFAHGIRRLMDNDKQRKLMGVNAKKMIEKEYAMDIISNKILNLYGAEKYE